MIKMIIALKFRDELSKEASREYWKSNYDPLLLTLPGVKHYNRSLRVEGEEDIGNSVFDGLASLWFENEDAAMLAMASPEMIAVKADAKKFADTAATKQFLAREVVMRDTPEQSDSLKLVTFNYRIPGMSPQKFQDYWENSHGPLVLKNFAALRRYVQNHALIDSYKAGAEPAFDGMLEAWLASFDALRAGEGTPEHEMVRADEANFLDPARFSFMFVRDRSLR